MSERSAAWEGSEQCKASSVEQANDRAVLVNGRASGLVHTSEFWVIPDLSVMDKWRFW